MIQDGSKFKTKQGEVCEQVTEKNYVFQVAPHLRQLVTDWAQKSDTVVPASIKNKVLDDLRRHSNEISISRPYDRLQWGIRVPQDPTQTIYVWVDALTNYLSCLEFDKPD